jgi:branched-chain amino acid transport system substrate-binding protein
MATQPDILRRGFKYVFRVIMESDRMSELVVVKFVEDMGRRTGQVAKRVAMISTDDNYGKSTAEDMYKALKKTKQEVVEDIYYPVKATNLDVEVARIKAAKPDIIYLCSYLNDGVLITKALYAAKVDCLGYVTQGAGYVDPQYIEMAGDLAEYFVSDAKFDYDLNRLMEMEFEAAIMKRYGVHANHHSAAMYGIVYLIQDVLERAGTIDRDKVRDAIAATNITSGKAMIMPGTHIRFDKNGENTGIADLMAQVLKGSYHTVWPFEWKRKFDPVWPTPKWEQRKR